MKGRVDKLEKDVTRIDGEVTTLREFKHSANGVLQSHNGKLDVIANQQHNTTAAIEKLTKIVEDAIKKIGALETIKAMAIGAGLIIPPTLAGCYFIFQWYLATLTVK